MPQSGQLHPWTLVGGVAGGAIALLALVDMALSALHVHHESPVSNRVSLLLWRIIAAIARRLPERARSHVLALSLVVLIGATIALWVVLFIAGFALLYLPFLETGGIRLRAADAGAVPTGLGDALYLSAGGFLTTMDADFAVVDPLARFLSMLERACGLLTFTLAITYLIELFPIVTRKIVLAVRLNEEAGGRTDGIALARRYVATGKHEALGQWLSDVARELLYLGRAHDSHPLLFYSRPREPHESFVRILAVVQGIVGLRYALDPRAHRDIVEDPRLASLEESLLYTLHGLAESIHLSIPGGERRAVRERLDAAEQRAGPSADAQAGPDARFGRLRAALAESGLTPAPESAERAYARFRAATDPYVRSYAETACYSPAAVWAPYDRHQRDAGLLSEEPAEHWREAPPAAAGEARPDDTRRRAA